MLKNPHEAWAEAWGAYHTKNPDLPDYIAKYVHERTNTPLDNFGKSGIIEEKSMKLTKLASDGSVVNPMNAKRYQIVKKNLEAKGCSVISAVDDDLRFLIAMDAEAISDEVGILHRGEIPSASAFFEEIIHYTQIKRYGAVGETDFVERAAREVAANRKLLKHGKEYGFTKEDFEEIKRNLSLWEEDFERRAGVSYDDSKLHREI
jgi:hypothetical protein